MDKNAIITATSERQALVESGAEAARRAARRSDNPHTVDSPEWQAWMDGYDHQAVWLELGRGSYGLAPRTALVPR